MQHHNICNDEQKAIRQIKEKYNSEYRRICSTLGWRDFKIGNLSAMEGSDLGPVEVKMRQLIQEEDEINMGKEEEKARQIRMANIEKLALSNHAEGAAKLKKSKLSKNNDAVVTSISSEDVRNMKCIIIL
jgi:hypothetical protein